MNEQPAVWFPAIRTNTGTDVFTRRLVKGLNEQGIKAGVTWLPLRAEYAPWTVRVPKPPEWANVVHVNTWLHPRFIPKNLPAIATIHHAVHHPDTLGYKGWLRAAYHKHWIAPMERRVMRRANKVVAVSQFVADTAKKTLVDVPIQVIYNGIDTNVFTPGTRVRKPTEPFRLLYVGSWMARKGVDLLAPIMSELGDEYELHYTGGPTSEKDKATMLPNMRDIGRLNGDAEVAKAMQNADALMFPSRSEGFGLVAAEAMACGLPVFTSAGSSVIEVIGHEETGYLCKSDNIADFTQAIRHLASNDSLRRKMSSTGRLSAKSRFSENIMLNAYTLQCYTQV
jgi:glycosyltransferase involved in cell wall biosynthesis